MDETIGVKGGANDRRRQLTIDRRQKKKLKEYEEKRETEELEKKVKKQQIYTLIKTLPIAIGGGTVQVLYDTARGKKKEDKEDTNSRWRIKEYDQDITHLTPREFEEKKRKVITTPSGEKIVIYISTPIAEKKDVSQTTQEQPIKEPTFLMVAPYESEDQKSNTMADQKKPLESGSYESTEGKGVEQVDVEEFIDRELGTTDFSDLSQEAKKTLGKLKSRKIVDEYEKRLKDIRYELRQVIYEYNTLVDENESVILSRDAEIILDRLSQIIDKVEELKARIKIDNLNQYDDNYVYYLIEGYLKEFHDKRIVKEIADSPLYILLEEKLEELDDKRGKLSKQVDFKKEKLEEKEVDFEAIKKKYDSIDQFNNQLLEFQYDQNKLLKEIQEKVANAVDESERVRVEFAGLTGQSRRMLRMLARQMMFPGLRGARRVTATTAAYLYFMRNIVNPPTRTVRYKVITVKDYHGEIQDSINSIEDMIRLLGKTSTQIDRMIDDIKTKFADYLGVIPECDELLRNLNKVQRDMKEKEYEMKRIKYEQEIELQKNDAKVKTIGEYPVN